MLKIRKLHRVLTIYKCLQASDVLYYWNQSAIKKKSDINEVEGEAPLPPEIFVIFG